MQTTNFLTLRGGYVPHRSSSLPPSVTSYSMLRRHSYISLSSSSTVCTCVSKPNTGSQGKPMDDDNEYMKEVRKWMTLSELDIDYAEEVGVLLTNEYAFLHYLHIVQETPNYQFTREGIYLAYGKMLKDVIDNVMFQHMNEIRITLLMVAQKKNIEVDKLGEELSFPTDELRKLAESVKGTDIPVQFT